MSGGVTLAVKIRLARHGAKKRPYYRVVVADGRMPRDGRYIEEVGRYNPLTNPKVIEINLEKVDEWISKGAQPTNAVSHLIDVARSGEVITEKKAKMSKKAAAKAAAAAEAAAAALERYQNGETLLAISKDYEDLGTYSSVDAGSNNGSAMSAWVFDAARTAGEGAVVTDDPNSYVVVFHSIGREEYNSVDVRHILFLVDSSSLDKDSETYDADLQALKDAAKAKADDALAQWQANGATEDAFAALANELSDDSGSNTNGGLYTKILKGQMVTEFNDWCFDPARKTGDTGIVYNEGSYTGYHVMYFVGEDIPAWQVSVENALISSDYAAWLESLVTSADAQLLDGMSSVG